MTAYKQSEKGIERDQIILEWYKSLSPEEKSTLDKNLLFFSNGLENVGVISILQLIITTMIWKTNNGIE